MPRRRAGRGRWWGGPGPARRARPGPRRRCRVSSPAAVAALGPAGHLVGDAVGGGLGEHGGDAGDPGRAQRLLQQVGGADADDDPAAELGVVHRGDQLEGGLAVGRGQVEVGGQDVRRGWRSAGRSSRARSRPCGELGFGVERGAAGGGVLPSSGVLGEYGPCRRRRRPTWWAPGSRSPAMRDTVGARSAVRRVAAAATRSCIVSAYRWKVRVEGAAHARGPQGEGRGGRVRRGRGEAGRGGRAGAQPEGQHGGRAGPRRAGSRAPIHLGMSHAASIGRRAATRLSGRAWVAALLPFAASDARKTDILGDGHVVADLSRGDDEHDPPGRGRSGHPAPGVATSWAGAASR